MLTLLRYSANLVFRPCWTMRSLTVHRHRVTFGFMGLMGLSAVYAAVTSVAVVKGMVPSEETLEMSGVSRAYLAGLPPAKAAQQGQRGHNRRNDNADGDSNSDHIREISGNSRVGYCIGHVYEPCSDAQEQAAQYSSV